MKIGLMFDNNQEVEDYLHPMLITETWANKDMSKPLFECGLTFSEKRRLVMAGVEENEFNMCKHLVGVAKRWSLITGVPSKYVITPEEWEQWKTLIKITEIVAEL